MKNFIVKYLSIMLVLSMCIVCVPIVSENVSAYETDDWLEGWSFRKAHVINQTVGVTTDYVFGLKVYNGTGTDGTETVNGVVMGKVYINTTYGDFREVRITESDGLTILPYWIQNTTLNDFCILWFKTFDDFTSSAHYYYVYYGNVNAFPMSNGDLVFRQFDDFEDSDVWTSQGLIISSPSSDSGYAEPSVIIEDNAYLIDTDDEVFKMWFRYSRLSVTEVRYSESIDGFVWETPITVINDQADDLFCPYVFKHDGTYYMYVHSGWDYFDCWSSLDGITWNKIGNHVLSVGNNGQWDDDALGNICVWVEGSTWYAFYEAKDGVDVGWYAGLATSNDGLTWTKEVSNPVIVEYTSGGPFIQKINGIYHLLTHSGENDAQLPTDVMYAYSENLIDWTFPYSEPVIYREAEYEGVGEEEGQISDVHIVEYKHQTYLFYEGVETQSQHRGIVLRTSGLPLNLLYESKHNLIYNVTDYWFGNTNIISTSNGYGVFTSETATWKKVNLTENGNYSYNYALSFYGYFDSNDETHITEVGFKTIPPEEEAYVSILKGSDEIHRSAPTYKTVSVNYDENYHSYTLKRLSTGSTVNIDGVDATWITDVGSIPDFNMSVSIGVYNNELNIDYIFSRPCVSNEPNHYIWESFEMFESDGGDGGDDEPTIPSYTGNFGIGKVLIILAGAIPFIGFIVWAFQEKRKK